MAQTELLEQYDMDDNTLKNKYLIFTIGTELYGIEIRYITEIVSIQPITEVAEMPYYVKGITNLRGKIIPIMDARLRFKKEERTYDDKTCIIVLDNNNISAGLIVDSVAEVLTIQEKDIAPLPELNKAGQSYIKGIGKADGSVRLLLDCELLLTSDAQNLVNTSA